jgi:hypothetical protein
VTLIDVAVMDAAWQSEVRAEVIERVLAALAAACGLQQPAPAWWVNFRVIDEGVGARPGVCCRSSRWVFTEERVKAVRAALGV